MNINNPSRHLNQDELLKSVVDTAELPRDRQAHLSACKACGQARSDFENRLFHLSRKAKTLTPASTRAFRLPDQQLAASRRFFRPWWAIGMMTALVLVFAVWGPFPFHSQGPEPTASINALADSQLMEAIDALVIDALPASYQELTAFDWPMLRIERQNDEEFIDWVVPPIDEDDYLT